MSEEYKLSRMKNPFMLYNGIEICSISPDGSSLKATITEDAKNPYGMVHGGLIYTLIDCTAGVTARADEHNYVTQSVNVNYLSNVKDEDAIYTESNVIKRGKSVVVIHVIVKSESGKLMADGVVNMHRLADQTKTSVI